METLEHYLKIGWKEIRCDSCDGYGQVSDYGCGEDFYGPKECSTCGGRGTIWLTPNGRHVEYPGGKFC